MNGLTLFAFMKLPQGIQGFLNIVAQGERLRTRNTMGILSTSIVFKGLSNTFLVITNPIVVHLSI